jgi:hypothetical protein
MVHKCIADEIIYFIHVKGKFNPSDLFTKILGCSGCSFSHYCSGRAKQSSLKSEKPLPEIIKEIKEKISKNKEKDPTLHS